MKKRTAWLAGIVLLIIVLNACNSKEKPPEKPNIVYILADDLGYGDISALNADSKIKTPQY